MKNRLCGPREAKTGKVPALLLAAALVIGLVASPASAAAQTQKKVIRLDTLTVEGKIQKPMAIYILQRSILNFGELERAESFLPKVVKSVEKDPF
mgnify:CR=1 FL=1|jgi:hypothetical protein